MYRHVLGDRDPLSRNVLGARWNPPGVPALYASLDRDTVVAEGDHLLASQPVRPSVARRVYKLRVRLQRVLDLTDRALLARIGVREADLVDPSHRVCRAVGAAAALVDADGMLVPSARAEGVNLVVLGEPRAVEIAGDPEELPIM